jgi:VTC domain
MMAHLNVTQFDKISLDEMSGIRLMSRIDSKYVVTLNQLQKILAQLENDYYVQEIQSNRIFDYATLYYDTPEYEMYLAHLNGKLNRLKIRTREYTESHLCFLEIKTKSNKGITEKIRIRHERPDTIESEPSKVFIEGHSPYSKSCLEGKIWSYYKRITLVNKQKSERLTIDLDLRFQNNNSHQVVELPDMGIIEVKKNNDAYSPALELFAKMRMRESSLSKYCIGVALTEPNIKKNKLKSKLLMLNKITHIIYESIG